MSFMSHLGQLEVRIEEEGVKFVHAAGNWVDHLTWSQVENLLMPGIRAAAPGVLAEPDAKGHPDTDVPDDQTNGYATLPTDVLDELRAHFGAWFGAELDGIRAEVGKELEKVHTRIDALGSISSDAPAVTTEAPRAAPAKRAASRPAKDPAASK